MTVTASISYLVPALLNAMVQTSSFAKPSAHAGHPLCTCCIACTAGRRERVRAVCTCTRRGLRGVQPVFRKRPHGLTCELCVSSQTPTPYHLFVLIRAHRLPERFLNHTHGGDGLAGGLALLRHAAFPINTPAAPL